jgi:hypothetical protein
MSRIWPPNLAEFASGREEILMGVPKSALPFAAFGGFMAYSIGLRQEPAFPAAPLVTETSSA